MLQPGDWPQARRDAAHSGYNGDETVLSARTAGRLGIAWRGACVDATDASVADGVVYVGCNGWQGEGPELRAYAVDCGTGGAACSPLWTRTTGRRIASSGPGVADGIVYVTLESNFGLSTGLYAYPVDCGAVGAACSPVWTAPIEGNRASGPVIADGVVYVTAGCMGAEPCDLQPFESGRLYAFPSRCASGGATCSPLWTAGTPYEADWQTPVPIAVAGDTVYVVGGQSVYAFAVGCASGGASCSALWEGTTGDTVTGSPAVADGVVYIGSGDGSLYSFAVGCASDGSTCAPLWTGDVTGGSGCCASSPAVADGMVYVSSTREGARLNAFAVGCGTGGVSCAPVWRAKIGGYGAGAPVVAGDAVYVRGGGRHRSVYAFAADCGRGGATCSPLWTGVADESGFWSSPTIANGVLYVGSQDQLNAYGLQP